MRDSIRVLILGTGQMGSGIARMVLAKRGLELVGAFGKSAHRVGMDLGQAIGLDQALGISVSRVRSRWMRAVKFPGTITMSPA